jgi:alpha-L-fucosidase
MGTPGTDQSFETADQYGTGPGADAARWIDELNRAEKALGPWRALCKKIARVYDGGSARE